LVLCIVKSTVGEDFGHVESSTGVVERVVVVDREVGSVPAVAVPNGGATFVSGVLLFDLHGDTNQESGKLVHDGKRGDGQGDKPDAEHVPVESGDRVETETAEWRSDGGEGDVVGRDPGHP
jgi:hypothetical protein